MSQPHRHFRATPAPAPAGRGPRHTASRGCRPGAPADPRPGGAEGPPRAYAGFGDVAPANPRPKGEGRLPGSRAGFGDVAPADSRPKWAGGPPCSHAGLRNLALAFVLSAAAAWPQAGALAPVVSKAVSRTAELPGEFQAFQKVSLHARVAGYVEKVLVDRGSAVKQGDLLAELSAPELEAQIAEVESKVQAAESDRLQAEAQLAGAESTYDRLKKASQTPGAIAGNELVQAEKQVEAAKALVRSREQASRAAQATVKARKLIQGYLKITAPFAGMVTERFVHPGALVGPGSESPMLEIQQISRLRLVVAVPEEHVGVIARGARVPFTVPAHPQRNYSGAVARISHTLDPRTRAMAVELEVDNAGGSLAPGMYPTVKWPVRRARPALFVPKTAVVVTTERTFVIRDKGGKAEWVDVKKGPAEGDLVEVSGNLQPGDQVVRRGTDELREGAAIQAKAQ